MWRRQRGRCWLCGRRFPQVPHTHAEKLRWHMHRHHVVFRRDGGSNHPDNIRLVHPRCHRRYHRHVDAFMRNGWLVDAAA